MPLRADSDFLRAALTGYLQRRAEIDACMAEIRGHIAGKAPAAIEPASKRRLSPEGRARIIAATKSDGRRRDGQTR